MPRCARLKSKTGIYHIMLRGINQQQIFEDDEDNSKFISILKEYKDVFAFKVLAYCLMGNHIHLLVNECDNEIGEIIKKIGTKFVYWYNTKYVRVGHLFQDRFKSEPVETDEYLLTVIRYIHQNPLKAGICDNLSDYKFSSYHEYIGENDFVDTDLIFEYISRERFIEFCQIENNDKCLDMSNDVKYRITDEVVQRLMYKHSRCNNVTEFQALEKNKQEKCIVILHNHGASIRQISRLTGISKWMVDKWVNNL
ncbi:MAG: transposase [Clostridia bacterium]|nr:transposase [Clostridia bacterium]